MNPLKSWSEIVIRAHPKRIASNRKELISCVLANITILLMILSLGLTRLVLVKLVPYDFRQIPSIIEILIFITMLCAIIRRSAKVNEWREKQIKPTK